MFFVINCPTAETPCFLLLHKAHICLTCEVLKHLQSLRRPHIYKNKALTWLKHFLGGFYLFIIFTVVERYCYAYFNNIQVVMFEKQFSETCRKPV